MIIQNGKTVAKVYRGAQKVVAVYHGLQRVFSSAGEVINWLTRAIDTDGTIYNGIGYKYDNLVIATASESKGEVTTSSITKSVTGFIPVKNGDVVHFQNCGLQSNSGSSRRVIAAYKADFTCLTAYSAYALGASSHAYLRNVVVENNEIVRLAIDGSTVAYIRICADRNYADAIITIN